MTEMSPENIINSLNFCVIDLETTGGNHHKDKIIEIASIVTDSPGHTSKVSSWISVEMVQQSAANEQSKFPSIIIDCPDPNCGVEISTITVLDVGLKHTSANSHSEASENVYKTPSIVISKSPPIKFPIKQLTETSSQYMPNV